MTVIHPKTRFTAVAAMMTILLFAPATIIAAEAPAGQIAQVNDTILLRHDLDREMKLVSLKLARQGRPVNAEQLKRYEGEIRDTLINRTLLLQQAKSAGIDVKDSAVVKALDEFKAAFKDEKAYQNALTEMGFTEEMLKSQINSGLNIKTLIAASGLALMSSSASFAAPVNIIFSFSDFSGSVSGTIFGLDDEAVVL